MKEFASKRGLSWISPWRSTYVFSTPSGSAVIVFTPEDLAWEMSNGKISLILEPVPLFDRAVSTTLEYLSRHSAARTREAVDRIQSAPPPVDLVRGAKLKVRRDAERRAIAVHRIATT